MEPRGSLSCSQAPTNCPYPEQDESCQCPPILFLKNAFLLFPHLYLGLPSVPFLSGVSTKPCMHFFFSFILTKCPTHLILLDLITKIIFSEDCKSCSSSWNFCSLLLFSPSQTHIYIFLSALSSNTLKLCSSLNVRDQVSHPYKTTEKNLQFCIF